MLDIMDICDMCDCTHYEILISQMAIHFYVVFIFPLSWSGISCKIKQEMFNLHENMGTSLVFQWRRCCSCFFSGVGAAPGFSVASALLLFSDWCDVFCWSSLYTFWSMLYVFLDCPLLIAPTVFSISQQEIIVLENMLFDTGAYS